MQKFVEYRVSNNIAPHNSSDRSASVFVRRFRRLEVVLE